MNLKKYYTSDIYEVRALDGVSLTVEEGEFIAVVGTSGCGKTTILQAIFAFDYANDELNGGKQVKEISNLYALEDELCEIKAIVNISKEEFVALINKVAKNNENRMLTNKGKQESLDAESDEYKNLSNQNEILENMNNIYLEILEKINEKYDEDIISFELTRVLAEEGNSYHLNNKILNKISNYKEVEETLGNEVIDKLPPILYSDDFNDRPPEEVKLTIDGNSSEWEKIYSRVFNDALGKNDYSIYSLYEVDGRRRKSTLSEVSKYLSNNLTDAWSRFSSEKKKITISFDI